MIANATQRMEYTITLPSQDWEAVCDALDRAGYHSIAAEIETQAAQQE